jgi:ubiquinone/menaquinone biosynthesis C-methylase UbiE
MPYIAVHGGTALLDPETIIDRLELKPDMKAADLGAGGVGHFTFAMSRRVGAGGLVYAVDIVQENLKAIKSRAVTEGRTNITTVWSNLEKVGATDIPVATLDAAILINVLFQNRKIDGIIAESARLLKAGGRLLVCDWRTGGSPIGPAEDWRVSEEEVERFARTANLIRLQSFSAGPYHYGILFAKS